MSWKGIMIDRNKTELTHNVTRLAALWLDGKGFKPVETEVPVDRKWVADIAGVICPTQTELIELKLIRRAPKQPWRHQELFAAWRAELDLIPSKLTALIEVKTSIGDFRGDDKWTREWPTNLCYLAMPEGMVDPMEWPKGWGVILFSRDGSAIRKAFPSQLKSITEQQALDVILAIAVARDHQTRYERFRILQKEIRIKDGEEKTLSRISTVISFVLDIMGGKPIEEAQFHHRIKGRLPNYLLEKLEKVKPASIINPPQSIDRNPLV